MRCVTKDERELLDDIEQMASEAPSFGLCAMPFQVLHTRVLELISERDILLGYRTQKMVKEYTGWFGQCPTCGAVFLDDSTNYCGNCGQKIAFPVA